MKVIVYDHDERIVGLYDKVEDFSIGQSGLVEISMPDAADHYGREEWHSIKIEKGNKCSRYNDDDIIDKLQEFLDGLKDERDE